MKRLVLIWLWLVPLVGVGQNSAAGVVPLLMLDSVAGNVGDTVTISLRVMDFTDIYYLTGTLLYDTNEVEFVSYDQDTLTENLSISDNDSGSVIFYWNYNSINPVSFPDSTCLFHIDFKVIGTLGDVSSVTFGDSPVPLNCANDWSLFGAWVVVTPDTVSGAIHIINDSPVGLMPNDQFELLSYPNPTTSTLHIQLPDGNLRATQTRLYDMTGRLVLQQPYNPVVDVSALDTGSYILVVETEQGRFRNVIRKE
jgi:hypothetical protein